MVEPSYENPKRYQISGVVVTSEVTEDTIIGGEQRRRSLKIRSSCESTRWGTRVQEHSYTASADNPGFAAEFEEIRKRAADTIVRIERGELNEGGLGFLLPKICGPTGKIITPLATVNLSIVPTLLGPEVIDILELHKTGQEYLLWSGGQKVILPLYNGSIEFGPYSVETFIAPSTHGIPACILGGDFFQKALVGREKLIYELILPDHYRTLANAARCKKKYVLILGKYGDQRARLEQIKAALGELGFYGLILDEYPDIEEQSLIEKFVIYASISRFVIVDDFAPSGHIAELQTCHERQFVTAILRQDGVAATAIQTNIADEVSFIHTFSYATNGAFIAAIKNATNWADNAVAERARRLNREYSSWRSPQKIMS